MKKIEVVIETSTLDTFKDAAFRLGVSQFEVTEIYSSRSGILRGSSLSRECRPTRAFSRRLRVGFVLFDERVRTVVGQIFALIRPDSILVLTVDQELRTIPFPNGHAVHETAQTMQKSSAWCFASNSDETSRNRVAANPGELSDTFIPTFRSIEAGSVFVSAC